MKLKQGLIVMRHTCVFGTWELTVEWFLLTVKHSNKSLLVSIQRSTHHRLHQGYSAEKEKGTI